MKRLESTLRDDPAALSTQTVATTPSCGCACNVISPDSSPFNATSPFPPPLNVTCAAVSGLPLSDSTAQLTLTAARFGSSAEGVDRMSVIDTFRGGPKGATWADGSDGCEGDGEEFNATTEA